jgi:hypothetical protein
MDGLAGRSIWINRFSLNKRLSALPRDCGFHTAFSTAVGVERCQRSAWRSSLRFLQLVCNR